MGFAWQIELFIQMLSFEVVAGFALLAPLMMIGSLSLMGMATINPVV